MERRNDDDDRRKIERVTNPSMRTILLQIRMCLRYLIALGAGLALFVIVTGVMQGPDKLLFSLLVMTLFAMLVFVFFRYHNSISFYLNNESSANLDRTMEAQSFVWITISFMATLSTIVYFVFAR